MNNLEDWLLHLEGLHPKGQAGIELGLERIRRVKVALGQIQHCPVIIGIHEGAQLGAQREDLRIGRRDSRREFRPCPA